MFLHSLLIGFVNNVPEIDALYPIAWRHLRERLDMWTDAEKSAVEALAKESDRKEREPWGERIPASLLS